MIRYVDHPAMAESEVIRYSKTEGIIGWLYYDHKDEVEHIIKEGSKSFKEELLVRTSSESFRLVRYYGFRSNRAREELDHVHELLDNKKNRDYSKETQKKKRC